jgi:hypothetical protein
MSPERTFCSTSSVVRARMQLPNAPTLALASATDLYLGAVWRRERSAHR